MALIESAGKKLLFDTGSYGDRKLLLERLREEKVDLIFLSHLHYDHCINAEIFKDVKIIVSQKELDYVLSGRYEDIGDPFIPFSIIKSFVERVEPVSDGEEIIEGVKVIDLAGHTPGSCGLLIEGEGILFAGDAVKNAWELVNRKPPLPTFGGEGNAIESQRKAVRLGRVIVPGHDGPFKVKAGKVEFIEREAPKFYVYWRPDSLEPTETTFTL